MATIKDKKDKKDRDQPIENPPDPVDYSILEYIYATPEETILADDTLIELIESNGFYKTSFCDAFGYDEVTIEVNKKDVTWYGPQADVLSNLEIFKKYKKEDEV